MKRRTDDISFENAWEKQYADESKVLLQRIPRKLMISKFTILLHSGDSETL